MATTCDSASSQALADRGGSCRSCPRRGRSVCAGLEDPDATCVQRRSAAESTQAQAWAAAGLCPVLAALGPAFRPRARAGQRDGPGSRWSPCGLGDLERRACSDAGLVVAAAGLADGATARSPGGFRFVIDRAVRGVRALQARSPWPFASPGSGEQGGDRQRESVDDGKRRTGPVRHWPRRPSRAPGDANAAETGCAGAPAGIPAQAPASDLLCRANAGAADVMCSSPSLALAGRGG